MSRESDNPKVILQNKRSLLGDNYEVVELQSNRVDQLTAFQRSCYNFILLPGTFSEIVSDALIWVSISGLLLRGCYLLPLLNLPWMVSLGAVLTLLTILVGFTHYMMEAVPDSKSALVYRLALILFGIFLGM